MNVYQRLISEATGLTEIDKVRMVEQYMRQIYFQSTLGTKSEAQLNRAAAQSAIELAQGGWNFR